MTDLVAQLNEHLPPEYPRIAHIEQDRDDFWVTTTDYLFSVTLDPEDYWRHLRLSVDAILLPKIIHMMRYGVIFYD